MMPALPSLATTHAVAFVASHKPDAEALGRRLADAVRDPDAFVRQLRAGLATLADPDYRDGQRRAGQGCAH